MDANVLFVANGVMNNMTGPRIARNVPFVTKKGLSNMIIAGFVGAVKIVINGIGFIAVILTIVENVLVAGSFAKIIIGTDAPVKLAALSVMNSTIIQLIANIAQNALIKAGTSIAGMDVYVQNANSFGRMSVTNNIIGQLIAKSVLFAVKQEILNMNGQSSTKSA